MTLPQLSGTREYAREQRCQHLARLSCGGRDWHPLLPVRTNWEVGTGKDEPLLTPRVGAHHGGVSARAAAELLLCSCRDIHLPF